MLTFPANSTANALQAVQSSGSILSLFIGVVVSFLSAILVYLARQVWEKRKLKRALLTEIEEMEGIERCANQMNRVESPPGRQLSADDVPAENSIPTTVYQSTASKVGLLGGVRDRGELEGAVKFYSKVLRYKSIISRIGRQGHEMVGESAEAAEADGGTYTRIPISDSDQEDLYNHIGKLKTVRERIIESKTFDVEYPEEIDTGNTQKN